jgi:hypothetical protein
MRERETGVGDKERLRRGKKGMEAKTRDGKLIKDREKER